MDKFFKISERGSTVKTEIMAGLTTFFAMAYIVVTNPNQVVGFSHLAPDADPAFMQIWNSVYIASIIAAVVGTLLMAFYAKMPFAQACGMGLNSFFFVSFVLPEIIAGGNPVDGYRAGLVIILVSGVVFLILSVTGVREKMAKSLPDCLKKAIPAGIGLFIAFIGLMNSGIIQNNDYVLVQFVDIHGGIISEEGIRTVLPAILALLGLFIIGILEKFKVKGSVLIAILAITVAYYPLMGTMPSFDMNQVGQAFTDFNAIGLFAAFDPTSWTNAFTSPVIGGVTTAILLIITFCIVDMFDTIGTLYGTAAQANMLDENGDPINITKCMTSDSVATVAGAAMGTSTCTTFVESSAGVSVGGRTGLTSLVVSICFFLCLFLTPLASLVPACATAPALIYVGVLMMRGFSKVDMKDPRAAIPAFLALIAMPLTYSISNGIGIGAIAYTIITVCTGNFKKKDIVAAVIAILFVIKFITVTV